MKINHLLLLGLSVGLSIQANATKYVYISTAEELASFRDAVNSGGKVTATDDGTGKQSNVLASSANIQVTADIDLSSVCGEGIGTWIPISNVETKCFSGTFDGGNHTIENLYINNTEQDNLYRGLFGYVSGATIKNMVLKGNVTTRQYVGAIAGKFCSSDMSNCFNYCNVAATGYRIGGICGESTTSSSIENCINYGNVTGDSYVGGIVGITSPALVNCANFGKITGNNYVGGLIGNSGSLVLNGCYNFGDVDGGQPITGTGINRKSIVAYNTNAQISIQPTVGKGFSASDFASGAVTYLLNNGTSVWKQTLGTDPYPVFEGGTVYLHKLEGDSLYSNASELDIIYHADGTYEPLVWSAGTNYTPADNSFLVTTNTNIGGHNVVLKNSDGTYSCNTFHLIDGQPFHSDFDITVDTLTYNRAATASAIVTMVLPADIPTDYLKGNLYILSGFDGTNVHFSSFEQETTEANTPYAIKPEDAETTILEDGARNVTIKGTNEINEIVYDNLTNFGEYEVASYISDDHYSYIIFSGGKLKKYKKINLSPFRAGFRLGLDEDITSATLGLMVDNELTGVIVTESEDNLSENVDVFDIQGRLVRANAEPSTCFNGLGKGIYIVNGKKFQVTANTQTAPAVRLKKSAAATTGYAE